MYPMFRPTTLAVSLTIILSASAPTLHAADDNARIVVTASRQAERVDELLADVSVIDRERIAQSGQSTLGELLAREPGIQVVSQGNAGGNQSIFIRGANSGHTLLLIDGIRFGSATAGQPAIETIPLASIERIEIVRGPASAVYGSDAIGGVIQIFTRRPGTTPRPEAFVGLGSQGTVDVRAGVSGGTKTVRGQINVGRYRTTGSDALARPTDADGFAQTYVNGKLSVSLPAAGELTATLLSTRGTNRLDAGFVADTRADKDAEVIGLRWYQPLNKMWTMEVDAGASTDSNATHDSGFDSVIRTRQQQFSWINHLRSDFGNWLAGLERVEEHVQNTRTAFAVTARRTDSALAGWRQRVGDHSLQINLRHDDSTQFGSKATHTAAYGYQLDDRWRAHVSFGTGFKAPTFNDLYFPLQCFPPFGCFGGNPALQPETAKNRELGVNFDAPMYRASAVLFDNRIANLIVWGNQPFNVGAASLRGGALSADGTYGAWRFASNYNYLRARDTDTGLPLIRRARNRLNASLHWTSGPWQLGGEVEMTSARDDTDFASGRRVRLGGYGLVHLSVRYAVDREWGIEARANNVGNKHYMPAFGFLSPAASVFVGIRYAPR